MNIPTLIVGDSGSGKSSSFRNLDPKTTVIINCERKILPFRSFAKFKNINVSRYKDFQKVIEELKKDTKYKTVVIDSLTSLLEISNKYCETVFSGYSIWSEYNSIVYDTLQNVKDLPQQVFITAIPEGIENGNMEIVLHPKTKGKEWKGSISKEFALVLYTHLLENDEGDVTDYLFDTRPSKHHTGKTPDGMFKDRFIENDVTLITKAIDEYYE